MSLQAPHAIEAVYTQVADVLGGKELLVRCDVGAGELAWEDGVPFTRAQLEGDVSLVNVYARANGCHELSGAASTGEPSAASACSLVLSTSSGTRAVCAVDEHSAPETKNRR